MKTCTASAALPGRCHQISGHPQAPQPANLIVGYVADACGEGQS
jgi:hypothetical protein